MPKRKRKFRIFKGSAVLLNLIAAFALGLSLLPAYFQPSSSPSLAVFGLAFPSLAILNILFVVFWLTFRSWYALLSSAFLLAGIPNFHHNFQFFHNQTNDRGGLTLKIMSYNVLRFAMTPNKIVSEINKNKILNFIKNEDPHITCLQEYFSQGRTLYEPLNSIKTGIHAEGAHYFESYFNPRQNQLSGLVIFSKYKAVGKGKLKFEGSRTFGIFTDLLIEYDTVRVYNIHLASIQLKPEDIDFVVGANKEADSNFTNHASSIFSKLTDAFLLREQQMEFLIQQMDSCKYPIILCGDFNDTPSGYVYNRITEKLDDTFVEKGKGLSITYAGQIPLLRIDYIMKSKNFKTLHYQRHHFNISDHFPVSAIVTMVNKNQ